MILPKKKRIIQFPIILLLVLVSVLYLFQGALQSVLTVQALPEHLILTHSDLKAINLKNITYSMSESTDNEGQFDSTITFKLFNLFPIRTIKADIEDKRSAYLGGFPVGISVKTRGVLVASKVEIETYAGFLHPESGVMEGDIILRINSRTVLYVNDIVEEMAGYNKNSIMVELLVLRGGTEVKVYSFPVIEHLTGAYKMGLAVKDYVDGVGTVSYIKQDGNFGCLGHSISGGYEGGIVPCHSGNIYKCKVLGYTKGSRGAPGELKGAFVDVSSPIGEVYDNNSFGIYGKLDYAYDKALYDIGSRFQVKNGKAKIRTTINDVPEFYDIEIIKASSQNSPCEKGMIIRVIDKALLSKTGGILQGMSGSPIIQNGKIVGVVTHVMLNDPTKGYAIYLDWMYDR